MPELISATQACERYDIPRSSFFRWVESGRLKPADQHYSSGAQGFRYMFAVEAIEKAMETYKPATLLPPATQATGILKLIEVAALLSVNRRTVERWCRSGELKAFKTKAGYRIAADDLDDFLANKANRH